jgi:TRAP-type C4-dicarboxylate transport system permease small subunit
MTMHVELEIARLAAVPASGIAGVLQTALARVNAVAIALSAVAVAAAGLVLTWEVAGRYFFQIPSEWQDELAVFLLVGATFMSAAWIQARRGHVGIHALSAILPPSVDAVRGFLADLVSFAFSLFFAGKCWALLHEAWADGQTSSSAWGPPLWIPYSLMAVGMTLLVLQLLLQTVNRCFEGASR